MGAYENSYYMQIFMGIVFTIAGTGIFIASCAKWKKRSGLSNIAFGLSFAFLGYFIANGMLQGPTPGENRKHDRYILRMSPEILQSVVLDPEYKNSDAYQNSNLVQKSITLTNKNEIAAICSALQSAEIMSPNHPFGKWFCSLTFITANRSINIRISSTNNQGVIIWLRQPYRCDEMGPVLESIVKRANFNNF